MALCQQDVAHHNACYCRDCGRIEGVLGRDLAPCVYCAGVLGGHEGDADRRVLLVGRVPFRFVDDLHACGGTSEPRVRDIAVAGMAVRSVTTVVATIVAGHGLSGADRQSGSKSSHSSCTLALNVIICAAKTIAEYKN